MTSAANVQFLKAFYFLNLDRRETSKVMACGNEGMRS